MTAKKPLAATEATSHTLNQEIALIFALVRDAGNLAEDRIAARAYARYLRQADAGITPEQDAALDLAVL